MANALYSILNLFGYGHPLHPVVVHLVIGPTIAMVIFALVAWLFKKPVFWKTARQLNVLSFIMWFPAVTIGVLDWQHFYGGSPAMTEILWKSIGAGLLFLILLGNILLFRKLQPESRVHLVFYLAAAVTVGFVGLMGGNIVYGSGKAEAASSAEAAGNPATQTTPDGFKRVVTGGYTLDWKVDGPDVHMRLSYATTGWVAVGFGRQGQMKDSHIIIGYVKDGQATVEDDFGYDADTHGPEAKVGGKSSITQTGGRVDQGVTTLSWTMPLKTGNPKDIVLTPGDSVAVILAHGDKDAQDLESYHGRDGRMATTITF
jgi:uncharacterized membrane protein